MKSRTFNVLRELAREYQIDALCFARQSGPDLRSDLRERAGALAPWANVEVFPIPQEESVVRLVRDHFWSALRRRSYVLAAYESSAFRSRLRRRLDTQRYDVVHADSLDLAGYFGEIFPTPLVCVHHDIQSDLLRRRAQFAALPIRPYVRLQSNLMERIERKWIPRVHLNVLVSERDRDLVQTLAPSARAVVVPNGVDTEFFVPPPGGGRRDGLVFLGSAGWEPNRDGMRFFAEEIFPLIRRRHPFVSLRWIGWADPRRETFASRPGFELLGHIPDIRPVLSEAACSVVPLRMGGGTRVKILDAWAMGLAVVSTSIGCEGLDTHPGRNILIADTPDQFADAVCRVLSDDALRAGLGKAGRATAEERYSWKYLGRLMREAYRSIERGAPGP